jgi:hypothetical protein
MTKTSGPVMTMCWFTWEGGKRSEGVAELRAHIAQLPAERAL